MVYDSTFIIENPIDSKVEIDPHRLFERFYTGDKSRHNGGTGVGLAVFYVSVIIDDLNYRSEPSMNGKVNGQTGIGVFTITEVKNGWGRLKSDAGWIYLENPSYCTIGSSVAKEPVKKTLEERVSDLEADVSDIKKKLN